MEALLKLRQGMLQEGMEGSVAALARPSLNSSVSLKNKAMMQSREPPKVTQEAVECEMRRLEAAGHAQIDYGMRDTLEASLVSILLSLRHADFWACAHQCRPTLINIYTVSFSSAE